MLLAGTVSIAATANAFVRTITDKGTPVKWPSPCVTMVVHVGAPPPNLTADLILTATQTAAATWSRTALTCTDFELGIASAESAEAAAGNDGQNNVAFRKSTWPYEPAALAITTVFARQDSGQILDADLEINALGFRWGDLVANIGTEGGAEDLQNTVTHEFGHVLGLDHNCFFPGAPRRNIDNNGAQVPDCQDAPADVQATTLFAAVAHGDIERRTLAPDDIAGVCAIYPATGGPSCAERPSGGDGGCSIGPGRRMGLVSLLSLAGFVVRRLSRLAGGQRRRGHGAPKGMGPNR